MDGQIQTGHNIPGYKKAAASAGIMSAASAVGIAVGILPHLIITAYFGLGRVTDGYLMGAVIVQAVTKVLKIGTLGKVYISVLARLPDKNLVERVMSSLASLSFIVFGGASVMAYVLAPHLASVIAPGFDDATRQVTITSVRILSPTILFIGLSELMMAKIQLEKMFSFSALVNLVVPCVTLVAVITTIGHLGITSALLGNLLGSVVMIMLMYAVLRRQGMKYRVILDFRTTEVKSVARMMTPFYGFSILMYAMELVPTVLSSALTTGGASALLYATRMRRGVVAALLDVMPTILYPSLSQSVASNNQKAVVDLIGKGVRFSSFVVVPALVGLVVLSQDVVRLVLQRGGFTEAATRDVATAFAILMIGLLTGPPVEVYSKALYAVQKTTWINVARVVRALCGMLLGLLLFKSFGLVGLAVAAASMTSVELVVLYLSLNRVVLLRSTLFNGSMLKIGLASVVLGATCFFVNQILVAYGPGKGVWVQLVSLFIAGATGILSYGVTVGCLRLQEYRLLRAILRDYYVTAKGR